MARKKKGPMTPEERQRYLYEQIREGLIQAIVAAELSKYWEANPPQEKPND